MNITDVAVWLLIVLVAVDVLMIIFEQNTGKNWVEQDNSLGVSKVIS
jgi:hypothetical protein